MYKRILVPVDGSSASMRGLDEAIELARHNQAGLRVLHVVDGIAFVDRHSALTSDADTFREAGRKLVKDVMARVKKRHAKAEASTVENLTGRAADSIVKEAKKWRADLIVMGTHGRRGFNRLVLGSDAEIVLRMAPVPVLLVRASAAGKKRKAR